MKEDIGCFLDLAKAAYLNAGFLQGDLFTAPQLHAERSATNLVLKWSELFTFPHFVLSAPELRSGIFWEPLTNQVTYQITSTNVQATVTVPIGDAARFFGLRMTRW